jgi:hypothetical protein
MKRYPILLTFTDTIKLGTKLLKMWLKCDQNVTNPFPKKRFPQKAGNICIIKIILSNFWGLNFVKIRHKRMAEISITTSRTLVYRQFKPVESPTYSLQTEEPETDEVHTHKSIKVLLKTNTMLQRNAQDFVGNILLMACLWDGNGVCCAL